MHFKPSSEDLNKGCRIKTVCVFFQAEIFLLWYENRYTYFSKTIHKDTYDPNWEGTSSSCNHSLKNLDCMTTVTMTWHTAFHPVSVHLEREKKQNTQNKKPQQHQNTFPIDSDVLRLVFLKHSLKILLCVHDFYYS